MEILVAGLILFFGTHSLSIVNRPLRDRLADRFGVMGWQGLYSLAALAGFVLMVIGYGIARQEPVVLYVPPPWLRHVAFLLLLFVFPLLLATYIPGRVRDVVQHPMLAATKIWAFAHLLANGMLHDAALFGAFLVWAVVGRISLYWRGPAPVPEVPRSRYNDWVAIVIGVALYVWFLFYGHGWLLGVPLLG